MFTERLAAWGRVPGRPGTRPRVGFRGLPSNSFTNEFLGRLPRRLVAWRRPRDWRAALQDPSSAALPACRPAHSGI